MVKTDVGKHYLRLR